LLAPVTDPAQAHWRLIEARWADEQEAQGRAYIYVKAVDEQGQPLEGVTFQADRGDAIDRVQTKGPLDQYWGNYLMTGVLGTYKVSMADGFLPSDTLINVGLGNEAQPQAYIPTSFFLTFQKVAGETTAPPPPAEVEAPQPIQPTPAPPPQPSPEPPAPPPEPVVPPPDTTPETPTEALVTPDFKAVLVAAARPVIYPVNRKADLYQYARANRLGDFLSAEFSLQFQGVKYRAQVFEAGIVFVRADGGGPVGHTGF